MPKKAKKAKPAAGKAYQLKITLMDIKPPIWRRLIVPDCRLDELNVYLQVVMGWCGGHLWSLDAPSGHFIPPEEDGWLEEPNDEAPETCTLGELWQAGDRKLRYAYDFGDGWEHIVLLEKELKPERGERLPICLAGARACPPEDCGGLGGYADLLEAQAAKKMTRDQKERLEWVGRKLDPEDFDPTERTVRLRQLDRKAIAAWNEGF